MPGAEAEELIRTDAGLASMKTALNARRAVLISEMATLSVNRCGAANRPSVGAPRRMAVLRRKKVQNQRSTPI